MTFIDYLRDRAFSLLINFMALLLIILILIFIELDSLLVVLISLIYVLAYIVCLIKDYIKRKNFYSAFNKLLNSLDKKYLIHEIVKKSDFNEGNLIIDYLYEIDKSFYEELNNYKYSLQEFKEYLELWCHEIKTPIATSKLVIQNHKNDITDSINDELIKIDNYVEQVMYYARSENVNEDYFISKVNLNEIVNDVIKRNKKDFINKKIKIKSFTEDVFVESDAKWLEFIFNQIIQNSIKYSKDKDAMITIVVKKNKNNFVLDIIDNGIGISEKDINNIFKKGFTGYNGRKKYNSTGMGLYLCKKLCNKLDHEIIITSVENEMTKVTLIFPFNSMMK